MKKLTIKQIWLAFFITFLAGILTTQLRPIILPNLIRVPETGFFSSLGFGYDLFFIVFFAALFEELQFRFMLTKRGFFHAFWCLLLVSLAYLTFFVFPDKSQPSTIFLIIFFLSCLFVLIDSRFKLFTQKYLKYLYNPGLFSIALSNFIFVTIHMTNYVNWKEHLVVLFFYQLLLHMPQSLIYTSARLNLKNGFAWAVWFHFLSNITAVGLSIVFPWL